MRNLLLLLLVVFAVGSFVDDKQQRQHLLDASAAAAVLTQQLADKDRAINALQARVQQLQAQSATQSTGNALARPGPAPASANPWALQGSSLDRPAYH